MTNGLIGLDSEMAELGKGKKWKKREEGRWGIEDSWAGRRLIYMCLALAHTSRVTLMTSCYLMCLLHWRRY